MSHPSFVSGACIRRHRLDPRRRKSSIIPRPRIRRSIVLGNCMEKEIPRDDLLDKVDQAFHWDQVPAVFRPKSPTTADRTRSQASAPINARRPARLPDGSWGSLFADRNPDTLPQGSRRPHHHSPDRKQKILEHDHYRGRRAVPGPYPKTRSTSRVCADL